MKLITEVNVSGKKYNEIVKMLKKIFKWNLDNLNNLSSIKAIAEACELYEARIIRIENNDGLLVGEIIE